MNTVNVIFPTQGEPEVSLDQTAMLEGQIVTWHVESHNPAVKHVRVRIEESDQQTPLDFFPGSEPQSQFVKALKIVNGTGFETLYGTAPSPNLDRVVYKYSVEGLDADKDVVVGRDPQLLTTRP